MRVRVGFVLFSLFLFLATVSGAWAGAISGTVANSSGKTGRIYLSVQGSWGDTGYGVSIAAPGSFQINGVPNGDYTVKAYMDTQGAGIRHANDPTGASNQFSVSSGNGSAGTITLNNPSSVAAQAPQVMVFRGSGGNFVIWDGPSDNNDLPIANKYTVSWSTSSSGSPVAGSKDVIAGNMDFFAHSGGSATLYYQVKAVAGATNASSAWTQGPAASGSGSVTGKVYFTGAAVTATSPLFVALVDESTDPPKFSVAAVTSLASGGSYTISNVPAGTYGIHPFIDVNNTGTFDAGDVGNLDNDFAPMVTVSSSPVTAPDMTLTAMNATTELTTQHSKGDSYEWYNINLRVSPMKKQPVNVQITSGPQIATPVDVAFGAWGNSNFQVSFNVGRPTVGDTYQVKVTYSDGTFETVPAAVTAVLDGFATPQAPVGFIPYNATPTFSWTAPSPAPAQYIYSIWVNESNSNGGSIWDAWGIPSSTTSLVYGSQGDVSQETLTDGTTYNWNVTVEDINGNRAQSEVTFTPTSAPAVGGFSPAGGLAGATVTIDGINFSTTPGNNTVRFNGTQAPVSAATATRLTVTVPGGSTTGKISVLAGGKTGTSIQDFVVGQSISFTGMVTTKSASPLSGALVELVGNTSVKTTSAAGGSFTLTGLPWNTGFQLKITKTGYLPVYTEYFTLQENLVATAIPYVLYTAADLNLSAGKSAIVARILDSRDYVTGVSGATATANGNNSGPYTVSYYNSGNGTFTGTATDASGIIGVFNVTAYDLVNLNASKSGWYFTSQSLSIPAGAVAEVSIIGFPPSPPVISGFSPSSGKAGDTVTINGGNFIANAPLDNQVKFNGVTATVTGVNGSGSTLWALVPAGATTGPITVTTGGGTATSAGNFTVQYTLTAAKAGTGDGSVVIDPPGDIYVPTSPILYNYNTPVTLTAVPDSNSLLNWSGCDSDVGTTCNVTMTADKSVTATFTYVAAVQLNGVGKPSVQTAFNEATNGCVIKARAHDFNESSLNLNTNPNYAVSLKGGYDQTYTSNSDYSNLIGTFTISSGLLTIENFVIQ